MQPAFFSLRPQPASQLPAPTAKGAAAGFEATAHALIVRLGDFGGPQYLDYAPSSMVTY
jgi:hypothetical protein